MAIIYIIKHINLKPYMLKALKVITFYTNSNNNINRLGVFPRKNSAILKTQNSESFN